MPIADISPIDRDDDHDLPDLRHLSADSGWWIVDTQPIVGYTKLQKKQVFIIDTLIFTNQMHQNAA